MSKTATLLAAALAAAPLRAARAEVLDAEYSAASARMKAGSRTARESYEKTDEVRLAELAAAQAPTIEIAASPAAVEFRHKMDSVLPTFREQGDGGYALALHIMTRGSSRYAQDHYRSVIFSLNEGRIIREENSLVYVNGSQRIPVAKTRWWYEPKWYLTKNARVRYKTEHSRDGSSMISGVVLVLRPQ